MAFSDGMHNATDTELHALRARLTKRLHALDEDAQDGTLYRSLIRMRERVSTTLDTRVVSPARPR